MNTKKPRFLNPNAAPPPPPTKMNAARDGTSKEQSAKRKDLQAQVQAHAQMKKIVTSDKVTGYESQQSTDLGGS